MVELQWGSGSSHVVVVVVVVGVVVVQLVQVDLLVCPPQPLVPTLLLAPLHVADLAVSLDRRCLQTIFETLAHEFANLSGRLCNHPYASCSCTRDLVM